jgi:hypothetical protein
MNKLILATMVASIILTGCKSTESVKYVDREIMVPKIIVEYCGADIIKKCSKLIKNNKDLIECYIINDSKIDEANAIIKLCKKKIERLKEKEEE